jgi:chorismate dehydratase
VTEQLEILRIGAVRYLNSRPLVECLPELFPHAEIATDVPSRLATHLADGRYDVALIPSIEAMRLCGARIVSDACVACDGAVRSVRMLGRVPPEKIATLALDDGSRTSAVMAQILLKERFAIDPDLLPLPIGARIEDVQADAVVVIGDRAMAPIRGNFAFDWDLGDQWLRWTGLPFVFAMWTAGPQVDTDGLSVRFAEARDRGVRHIAEIARREASVLDMPEQECLDYLRRSLQFRLGEQQREGLEHFGRLAIKHGLAPKEACFVFDD